MTARTGGLYAARPMARRRAVDAVRRQGARWAVYQQAVTASGNEITNAGRVAALAWGATQQGGSTDGATPPAGFGIWEAGTNLFRRGQCDSVTDWNASGGGVTIATDATVLPPFSTQSIKVTTDGTGANQGCLPNSATGQAAATGVVGVGSVYFKGVASASYNVYMRWANTDASNTLGTTSTFTATGAWQQLIPPSLAVAAGKTGDKLIIRVEINGTRAESFWVAHAMLQKGVNVVSPYIATSGGSTASRSAARVQAPASLLNATQGWVAMRVKMGWANTNSPGAGGQLDSFMNWWDGTSSNRVTLGYDESSASFRARRKASGSGNDAQSAGQTFSSGATKTVVMAWTATQTLISVDGGAFVAASNSSIPSGLGSTFDIGANSSGFQVDSSVLWFACGTGTLTDADAATLYALGDTLLTPYGFPLDAGLTMLWPCFTTTSLMAA